MRGEILDRELVLILVLGAVDLCVEVAPELVEELVRDVRGGRVDDLGESEDEGEGEGG